MRTVTEVLDDRKTDLGPGVYFDAIEGRIGGLVDAVRMIGVHGPFNHREPPPGVDVKVMDRLIGHGLAEPYCTQSQLLCYRLSPLGQHVFQYVDAVREWTRSPDGSAGQKHREDAPVVQTGEEGATSSPRSDPGTRD